MRIFLLKIQYNRNIGLVIIKIKYYQFLIYIIFILVVFKLIFYLLFHPCLSVKIIVCDFHYTTQFSFTIYVSIRYHTLIYHIVISLFYFTFIILI